MIRVNLLGVEKARRRRARAPMVLVAPGSGLILALFVLVLVGVAGVQYWRYSALRSESAQLDQQIQELEREKAELAQVQQQYELFSRRKELLQARINVIEQLKAQQSGPVLLLNTLASSISGTQSIWLTNFDKTGNRVNISGVALNMRSVADLMTRLITSRTFQTIDLRETAQDTRTEYESFTFTIEAQLAPMIPAPAAEQQGAA